MIAVDVRLTKITAIVSKLHESAAQQVPRNNHLYQCPKVFVERSTL